MLCSTLLCLLSQIGNNTYVTGGLDFSLNKARTASYSEGAWCADHWCRGPRSQLRIGTTLQLSKTMELNFGLVHWSYIQESRDRGDESAFVSMTFKPFR